MESSLTKLNSQYQPAQMLAVFMQKTDGSIHLIRLTANQQARLSNFLFNQSDGELETVGEMSIELLEWFYDGKFKKE